MTENRLFIIDALALIYAAYHFNSRNNNAGNGTPETATVHTFGDTLHSIIKLQKPTHIAVAFDIKAPTFRHQLYPAYKAQRKSMPDTIKNAIPLVKELLKKHHIQWLEKEGYEADDIVGTMAKVAVNQNFMIYIVSPDKDFYQLLNANTFIYSLKKSGTAFKTIGLADILRQFNVPNMEQWLDLRAFEGDRSDNIPNIRGFGKRLAKKLLAEFGSIEHMYSNINELNPALQKILLDNKEALYLNKKLLTIDKNVPVDISLQKYATVAITGL